MPNAWPAGATVDVTPPHQGKRVGGSAKAKGASPSAAATERSAPHEGDAGALPASAPAPGPPAVLPLVAARGGVDHASGSKDTEVREAPLRRCEPTCFSGLAPPPVFNTTVLSHLVSSSDPRIPSSFLSSCPPPTSKFQYKFAPSETEEQLEPEKASPPRTDIVFEPEPKYMRPITSTLTSTPSLAPSCTDAVPEPAVTVNDDALVAAKAASKASANPPPLRIPVVGPTHRSGPIAPIQVVPSPLRGNIAFLDACEASSYHPTPVPPPLDRHAFTGLPEHFHLFPCPLRYARTLRSCHAG